MPERKRYVVAEDLKPYLFPLAPWKAVAPLPNLEEIPDPKRALWEVANHHPHTAYYNAAVMLPGDHYPTYVRLYTFPTPMGSSESWDGRGLVLTHHNTDVGRVFRFALCRHEMTEEGHNPNPGRGWHPGHCRHCGMDMTVDSGD